MNYHKVSVLIDVAFCCFLTDWGRIGGEDSDGTLANCKARAAAYIANNSVQYGDDSEGNACGTFSRHDSAGSM